MFLTTFSLPILASSVEIIFLKNINEKNLEVQYKNMLNTGTHEELIKIIKTTYLRNEDRVNSKKRIKVNFSPNF